MIDSAWIRRPVSLLVWLTVATVGLALLPILLAGGRAWEALRGDRRPVAMTRVFCAYFLHGIGALLACGLLWLASGCGLWMGSRALQAMHWRLLGWFVSGIAAQVREAIGVSVTVEASGEALHALRGEQPLIVLSRHAGPGDTILLVDLLLRELGRRPSIVFKDALILEPTIDLIAHRLPQGILEMDHPEACEERIAEISRGLAPRGVLLLYPEGGNFTPERRRRALRSLRRRGERRALAQGRRMTHVLPPRPAGTIAALRANPAAPVVFVAHTGLGLAAFPRQIYRELPLGGTLRMRMWLVAPEQVPVGEQARREWLGAWWERLDGWIEGRGEEAPDPPGGG